MILTFTIIFIVLSTPCSSLSSNWKTQSHPDCSFTLYIYVQSVPKPAHCTY